MNDDKLVRQIADLWPARGAQPSPQLLRLVDRAVKKAPYVGELWRLRGLILHRCDGQPAAEILKCFERAIELDPGDWESFQEAAFVLDVYEIDLGKARDYFERAISLGAADESYVGLARVLAELGLMDRALDLLSEQKCPFAHEHVVISMRNEIVSGFWNPL